jgi:HEAT repeat protein
MKRPDPTETALDALRQATDMAPFLQNRSSHVVAKAAERAMALQAPVATELVAAFRRLLPGGGKSDPGCTAKIAIVRALVTLEDAAAEVYWAGVRHIQMEGVKDGWIDTAAELRGLCAIGLVRMGHPDARLEAVRLLSDRESETRVGAIKALGDSGDAGAEMVLRHKAVEGDSKTEVVGECFSSLLRLGPRVRALPFVAGFLESVDAETAETAAIALGESRMADAWPLLKEAFERGKALSAVMLGMALLRNDDAIAFLIERVEKDRERVAAIAIEVLANYRHDDAIRGRVEKAVAGRTGPVLQRAFQTAWGGTA